MRTLVLLMLVLVSLAGCSAPASVHAATGVIAGPEDCEGLGELREWDMYVDEAFPRRAHEEGRTMSGFAFGTSPDGPFSVPGPELRVRQCDTVRVTLHDPPTNFPGHTIHWHGISVPWAMDGVPFMTQDVTRAGQAATYTYEFVAWESGTYWYHCHVEAPSHVDMGLFGAFIVEPLDPAQDPPHDREETLILHETDSQWLLLLDYLNGRQPGPNDLSSNPFDAVEGAKNAARTGSDIAGFIVGGQTEEYLTSAGPRPYYPLESVRYRPQYDTFMINGKAYPDTEPLHIASGETLRIRLINAGQLVHTMHVHGHHFEVTHKDGYRLPQPYWADTIMIGPAERYDILVHGTNVGVWDVHDHGGGWNVGGYTSNDYAFPGGMNTMLVYDDFDHPGLPAPQGASSGDYALFGLRGSHAAHGAPAQAPESPDGHAADGHATDGQATDGQATDGHATEGHGRIVAPFPFIG